MTRVLGIEIGGTKLQLVVGTPQGSILERRRFTIDPVSGAAGIRAQIAAALPLLAATHPFQAVSIGFGGPVDIRTGCIARSHQIEGWSGFDFIGWLRPLVGSIPIQIENDANVAALGEALAGAGQGCNPVFYVTLGSGVGGGLVVHRTIYHGAPPGEAEIGHVRLDREGTILEQRCSGWAVDRRIRAAVQQEPQSRLAQLVAAAGSGSPGRGEAKHLRAALDQSDALAQRILQETATDLAWGLSHVTQLFHPEVIVLGGGLSLVGEPLRAAVAAALPRWTMEVFGRGPEIRLASLGEDAVPTGCLLLGAGKT